MNGDFVWRPPTPEDIPAIFELASRCDRIYGTQEATLVDHLDYLLGSDSSAADFARIILRDDSIVGVGWAGFSYNVLEERAPLHVFANPELPTLFEDAMRWLTDNHASAWDLKVVARADRILAISTAEIPSKQLSVYKSLGFEYFYTEFNLVRSVGVVANTPATGLEILPWTEELHAGIREAYNSAFSARDFQGYDDEEWPRAFAPEDVCADVSFVGRHGNSVVAFLFAEVPGNAGGWTDPAIRDVGWIDSIGVRPTHMGAGIATALISRAIDVFRNLGIEHVGLRVNENNLRALSLYDHLGFERSRKHVAYRRTAH